MVVRLVTTLPSVAFNLTPLYGLHAWGWDAFQLLLLYWAETVILFASALARIAFIPAAQRYGRSRRSPSWSE